MFQVPSRPVKVEMFHTMLSDAIITGHIGLLSTLNVPSIFTHPPKLGPNKSPAPRCLSQKNETKFCSEAKESFLR